MRFLFKFFLYFILIILSFVGFVIYLFPTDQLKTRLAHEIERMLGPDKQVSIGEMAFDLPQSIVLNSVEVKSRSQSMNPIKISEAHLKFYLTSLMARTPRVDFDLFSGSSEVSGSFFQNKNAMAINLKMDHLDLRNVSFLTSSLGVITGSVSGTIQLEIYSDDFLRDEGNANLKFSNVKVDSVEMNTPMGPYKLPAIALGNGSRFDIGLSRGNFDVRAFQVLPGDLGIDFDGKVYGGKRPENFRLNLKGQFKIPSPVLQQDGIMKIFLGKIQKEMQPDSSYPITITGRFLSPEGRFLLPNIRIGESKLEDLFKRPEPPTPAVPSQLAQPAQPAPLGAPPVGELLPPAPPAAGEPVVPFGAP